MRVSVTVVSRSVIPASGMLTVAKQVYWPLSDSISGENTFSTELVLAAAITVELASNISVCMSGSTAKLRKRVAEHFNR